MNWVLLLVLGLQLLAWWHADRELHAVVELPEPLMAEWSSWSGPYEPNERLRSSVRLADGVLYGPETPAVDSSGAVYTATADGWLWRVNADSGVAEKVTYIGGRVLGLAFDADDNLYLADAARGLLRMSAGVQPAVVEIVASTAGGQPISYADDLAIAADGIVYFSDASELPPGRFPRSMTYTTMRTSVDDLLSGRPTGRLLAYNPKTGKTEVLLRQLWFANGVALAAEDKFVVVAETWAARIWRYWLKGEMKGKIDLFSEGFPGFIDGLASTNDGGFWVAIPSPPPKSWPVLIRSSLLRGMVSRLPSWMRPGPVKRGIVVKLDRQGRKLFSLQDPDGSRMHMATGMAQQDGTLFIGSLHSKCLYKLQLEEGEY